MLYISNRMYKCPEKSFHDNDDDDENDEMDDRMTKKKYMKIV